MKRFAIAFAALVGAVLVALPANINSSVTAGRVTFTFDAPDVDVTLVGDMNNMNGETMLWSDRDGYFYLDYTLTAGTYEYYLKRGGDAVNVMFYVETNMSPKPDYYVDDNYGGLNAVIILQSRQKVRFTYTPPDNWDCFDPELDNNTDDDDVSVIIVSPTTDNQSYKMYYDKQNNSYSGTIKLNKGYTEFYFDIADDPINNMRFYDGLFEPKEDGYIDDGYGGYNAIVKVN